MVASHTAGLVTLLHQLLRLGLLFLLSGKLLSYPYRAAWIAGVTTNFIVKKNSFNWIGTKLNLHENFSHEIFVDEIKPNYGSRLVTQSCSHQTSVIIIITTNSYYPDVCQPIGFRHFSPTEVNVESHTCTHTDIHTHAHSHSCRHTESCTLTFNTQTHIHFQTHSQSPPPPPPPPPPHTPVYGTTVHIS